MSADVIALNVRREHRRSRPPAPPAVRVLVAGDPGLRRAGVRALLEREPGVAIVGLAPTADVVVLVADRDGTHPLDALRRVLAVTPGARVIVVADPGSRESLITALATGVRGVVSEDAGPSELVHAVRLVAAGQVVLSPRAARRLVGELSALPTPTPS